jgi:hypothetical protein
MSQIQQKMTMMAAGVGFLQTLDNLVGDIEDNGTMKNQIASLSETITYLLEKFTTLERKLDKLNEAKEQGWTWI